MEQIFTIENERTNRTEKYWFFSCVTFLYSQVWIGDCLYLLFAPLSLSYSLSHILSADIYLNTESKVTEQKLIEPKQQKKWQTEKLFSHFDLCRGRRRKIRSVHPVWNNPKKKNISVNQNILFDPTYRRAGLPPGWSFVSSKSGGTSCIWTDGACAKRRSFSLTNCTIKSKY